METKQLIVPFVLALAMTSCVFSDPLRLTETDNGRTNRIDVGREIEVVLKGNPTTGYAWDLASFSTNQFRLAGPGEYRQDEQSGGNLRVGVGGKYIFKFKAVQPGGCDIKLIYRRSWETTSYDKVYSAIFEIK